MTERNGTNVKSGEPERQTGDACLGLLKLVVVCATIVVSPQPPTTAGTQAPGYLAENEEGLHGVLLPDSSQVPSTFWAEYGSFTNSLSLGRLSTRQQLARALRLLANTLDLRDGKE